MLIISVSMASDMTFPDENEGMLLHAACYRGETETALKILGYGVDVNERDPQTHDSALHRACEQGYTETAQMLIEKKASIDTENMYGYTPFYVACWKGHIGTALMLAGRGANINVVIRKIQKTALSWIADEGIKQQLCAASQFFINS